MRRECQKESKAAMEVSFPHLLIGQSVDLGKTKSENPCIGLVLRRFHKYGYIINNSLLCMWLIEKKN